MAASPRFDSGSCVGTVGGVTGGTPEPFRREDYEREIEQLRPRLILWAVARMGPALTAVMDAEDLADIVLGQVHRDVARFRGTTRQEFQGWVFRIADTTLKDEVDRAKAQKRQPRERPLRDRTTPSEAAQRNERVQRLRDAITRLKPEHRDVIRMVKLEGLEIAEVAQALDKTSNAVRIQLCRALTALGDELGVESF